MLRTDTDFATSACEGTTGRAFASDARTGAPPLPEVEMDRFPRPLGIVCGLRAERLALGPFGRNDGIEIAVSGARPDAAEAAAERMAAAGARALLSVGFAGGLDPALAPGHIFAVERVVDEEGRSVSLATLPSPAGWAPPDRRVLFGSEALVQGAGDKAKLRAVSGAAAVDMETHRVARVAERRGLPCYGVRAICDDAGRDLPAFLASAIAPDGRPDLLAVLRGILREPGRIGTLVRLGADQRAARASLARWAEAAREAGL